MASQFALVSQANGGLVVSAAGHDQKRCLPLSGLGAEHSQRHLAIRLADTMDYHNQYCPLVTSHMPFYVSSPVPASDMVNSHRYIDGAVTSGLMYSSPMSSRILHPAATSSSSLYPGRPVPRAFMPGVNGGGCLLY